MRIVQPYQINITHRNRGTKAAASKINSNNLAPNSFTLYEKRNEQIECLEALVKYCIHNCICIATVDGGICIKFRRMPKFSVVQFSFSCYNTKYIKRGQDFHKITLCRYT